MEDLNSIPGFEEIFNISHPEFAKMNTLTMLPTAPLGVEPPKGGNGLKIVLTLLGIGISIGIFYILIKENQRKNSKCGDDRPKRTQNLN